MYAKSILCAAVLAAAPVAQAGDTVDQLARESGLSERHVRMLLGARTPYAEYRCCYERKLRQFKAALGEENYRRLAAGMDRLGDDVAPAQQQVARTEAPIEVQHRAR